MKSSRIGNTAHEEKIYSFLADRYGNVAPGNVKNISKQYRIAIVYIT
jgi:hypothetical protein